MPLPPENPENFDKVNYVIDAWSEPCDAPWYIYIETLKPAALEAFIVLISFGWADVIRGRFRPKGLGRRTSKRKGKWARRLPNFPEIGNTLGKALPFGEQIDDYIKWGNKTKFLWRIDNAMQAGLFFWLVADVAEDFAFNWTSLLYKTYWCRASDRGRFSYQRDGKHITPGNQWYKVEYTRLDYQYSPPTWFNSVGGSGPNGCTVMASMNWERHGAFPIPNSFSIRIVNRDTGGVFAQTGTDDDPPKESGSLALMGRVGPGVVFQVEVYCDGEWCWHGPGAIAATETSQA